MEQREIIIKKSKALIILMGIFAAFFWVFALLFLLVCIDEHSYIAATIILGLLAILFTVVFWGNRNFLVNFRGNGGIYRSFWGKKREFYLTELREVQVLERKGAYAFDHQGKHIFTLPFGHSLFFDALFYLKSASVPIKYDAESSYLEEVLEQLANDGEIVEWPEQSYYEEQESPGAKRWIRMGSVIQVAASLAMLLLLFAMGRTASSIYSGLFLSGFFFVAAMMGIWTIISQRITRKKIRQGGQEITGTIAGFYQRSGKKAYPRIVFSDEKGLHSIVSGDYIKIPRKEEASWLQKEVKAIYNPDYPYKLLLDGYTDGTAVQQIVASVVFAVFILAAAIGLWVSISYFNSPERRQGDKLKTKFEDSFKESPFTQADIDSDTVQWICAAYANYTKYNNKDLGVVGGITKEHDSWKYAAAVALEGGWGISDRESAIDTVHSLLDGGHRSNYLELVKKMKEKGMMDMSEQKLSEQFMGQDDEYRYIAAYRAYHEFGDKALDGWDFSRALQILGDCYQSGYISLEECLDQSLPIAKELQKEFGSWDELGKSYLYGYQYWKKDNIDESYTESGNRKGVHEELLSMQDGPYTLPYDTELKSSWSDVKIEKKKALEKEKAGTYTEEERDLEKDKKGYYYLQCLDDEKTVKVKLPKGYELEDYSDKNSVMFKTEENKMSGYFMLRNYGAMTEERVADSAYMEANMQGGENVEIGSCKKTEIEGREVFFINYTYTKDGSKFLFCYAYMALEGDYTLNCGMKEVVAEGEEFSVLTDESIVDTVFKKNIKWE